MDISILTGSNTKSLSLNGRLYELKPLTPRMTKEMIAWARSFAIQEFFKTAKACGMPGDIINSQLKHMNDVANVEELLTPDALAFLLYLRCKHAGVSQDEVFDIPQVEILEMQSEILDEAPKGDEEEPVEDEDVKKNL